MYNFLKSASAVRINNISRVLHTIRGMDKIIILIFNYINMIALIFKNILP